VKFFQRQQQTAVELQFRWPMVAVVFSPATSRAGPAAVVLTSDEPLPTWRGLPFLICSWFSLRRVLLLITPPTGVDLIRLFLFMLFFYSWHLVLFSFLSLLFYLLSQADPKMPKSRKLLAVPFVGKDVPSRASEFSHPDVVIGQYRTTSTPPF